MKVSFRRTERAEVRVQRLGSWNVLRWSATGRRRGPLAFSANVDLGHVQKHIQTLAHCSVKTNRTIKTVINEGNEETMLWTV